jgi:hypothetical protein
LSKGDEVVGERSEHIAGCVEVFSPKDRRNPSVQNFWLCSSMFSDSGSPLLDTASDIVSMLKHNAKKNNIQFPNLIFISKLN